ncbi:MAG: homoserine O-succinyltransferase, partial [Eggerthellaceae bacterium]|nr:homoserine O-succinyltransferase [Eggerthellaceae bacterium]
PHSRYTEVRAEDIEAHPHLELVAVSDEAGGYIAKSKNSRHFFVFGHPEYDRATLDGEYERDIARGLDIAVPAHYYPNDDPSNAPKSNWRAHAQLLYTNWLNYYVYQTTPYDIEQAGEVEMDEASDAELQVSQEKLGYGTALGSTPIGLIDARLAQPAKPAKTVRPAQGKPAAQSVTNTQNSEFIRAENEDDDGYDPYSDRREEPPLFEPDPWN